MRSNIWLTFSFRPSHTHTSGYRTSNINMLSRCGIIDQIGQSLLLTLISNLWSKYMRRQKISFKAFGVFALQIYYKNISIVCQFNLAWSLTAQPFESANNKNPLSLAVRFESANKCKILGSRIEGLYLYLFTLPISIYRYIDNNHWSNEKTMLPDEEIGKLLCNDELFARRCPSRLRWSPIRERLSITDLGWAKSSLVVNLTIHFSF